MYWCSRMRIAVLNGFAVPSFFISNAVNLTMDLMTAVMRVTGGRRGESEVRFNNELTAATDRLFAFLRMGISVSRAPTRSITGWVCGADAAE